MLAGLAVTFILAAGAQAAGSNIFAGIEPAVLLAQGSTAMSTAHTAQPSSYTHTLRITFSYDGPNLEIVRVQRVAMRAPAPATPPPQDNQVGHWLEVRDSSGALLYHHSIHDPMRQDVESFGDTPGDPMRRHPRTSTKGEFEVLVPDIPGAQTFRLNGPPATGTHPSQRAQALAARSGPLSEHRFDELRRLAGEGSRQ
jgi:hypothetical protein